MKKILVRLLFMFLTAALLYGSAGGGCLRTGRPLQPPICPS